MVKGYSYDPAKIKEPGMDRMRFELGDTMVEGGPETSALADAEIEAVLEMHPKKWKQAKLALLESICRRFAYEPDTKTGPVSFSLGDRAKIWREDYEKLKKEAAMESCAVPASAAGGSGSPPYFYAGMHSNERGRTGC